MEETPQRVLVVTPHPDDAEFWAGGTIARWAKEGATVHYVLCTEAIKAPATARSALKHLGHSESKNSGMPRQWWERKKS
jgi:LmbE family N-acetylglucosaminyl deacetylase